jgi:CheY-like chemotaxis protein
VVADDDPAIRRALAIALEADGHEVLEAEDGAALLDICGDQGPDASSVSLVITDVRMPGLTGLQALASLRGLTWRVPCIVVTAFATPEAEAQALRLGASAVFRKPFDVDDLRTAVANLLGPPNKQEGSKMKGKELSIIGIIRAHEWDRDDNAVRVCIVAEDGEEYVVHPDGRGEELLDLVDLGVSATGTVREDGDTKTITVRRCIQVVRDDFFDSADDWDVHKR